MNDYGKLRVTRGEPIFAKGQILEVLPAHLIRIFMGIGELLFNGLDVYRHNPWNRVIFWAVFFKTSDSLKNIFWKI